LRAKKETKDKMRSDKESAFDQVIKQYHKMLDEFSRGNPQSAKMMYSHLDDVTLVNPFGTTAVGWKQVSDALDYASSRFRDGNVKDFKLVAKYESSEQITIYEVEKWRAKVGGVNELSSFDLRVTSTFRFEEMEWKLVHRHADPIASFNEKGPLRNDQ
jgi:hypothetical protein